MTTRPTGTRFTCRTKTWATTPRTTGITTAAGRVIDLDHLMVYGQEGSDQPYPVKYHGDGLPAEGIDPRELPDWDTD